LIGEILHWWRAKPGHDEENWEELNINEHILYSLGGCEETEFDLTEPLQVKLVSDYDYDCEGCGYAPAGVQIHMNDKHKVPRPGSSGDK
jgi:hypothetical protein